LQTDVALFWAVLAGLLWFDNLVLVPRGGDCMKFDGTGRLWYEPSRRLQARGRDLVLLNPLNPFDRLVLTQRAVGPLAAAPWRSSQKQVRQSVGGLNRLSWLGSGYLVLLLALAVSSLYTYFGLVLALLACTHLLVWGMSLRVLVQHRAVIDLTRYQVFTLAIEALLVPGYLVNLAKRVGLKRTLDLPALSLGLRKARRMADDPARELYCLRLLGRLDEVAFDLGLSPGEQSVDAHPATGAPRDDFHAFSPQAAAMPPGPALPRPALLAWMEDARKCLTTSVP
jgi:hypothetical protein